MSKTTKISFAPDDGVAGHVTQRHHHVQTDEDLDPPTLPNNYVGHTNHNRNPNPSNASSSSTASRTINGYLLMERLEKLELGQDRLSLIISDLTSVISDLKNNLNNPPPPSNEVIPHPKKCHKSICSQSDTGVQTEEVLFSQAEIREKDKEIMKLRKELFKISHAQHRNHAHEENQQKPPIKKSAKEEDKGASTTNESHDFDSESPLNLFIECFKKKYDVAVHPNDVAIFV